MFGMGAMRVASRRLASLFFPPRCAYCDADLLEAAEPLFCNKCRGELAPAAIDRCFHCAARVPSPEDTSDGCYFCRGASLKFDRVFTLGSYDGPLRHATLRMKHWHEEPLTLAVAQLVWQRLADDLRQLEIDAVAPVPMHWSRRFSRATNSPDLLAATFARHLGTPLGLGSMIRRRNTRTQSSLPPGQRFENVRGAFRLRRGVEFRGAHVLLVDDILTTGATCSEVARVFKQAGAAKVHVAVVARAQGRA